MLSGRDAGLLFLTSCFDPEAGPEIRGLHLLGDSLFLPRPDQFWVPLVRLWPLSIRRRSGQAWFKLDLNFLFFPVIDDLQVSNAQREECQPVGDHPRT